MADLNDLSKPDLSSDYATEILQTIKGHFSRLWKFDYSGMGGLVPGMMRLISLSGGNIKLVKLGEDLVTEETVFDSTKISKLSNVKVFTASSTFEIPSGVSTLKVTAVGAGGGGGGVSASYSGKCGGGGQGGGFASRTFYNVIPLVTLNVTVGAGGAAGSGTSNGSAGGNSGVTTGLPNVPYVNQYGGTEYWPDPREVKLTGIGGAGGISGFNGGQGGAGAGNTNFASGGNPPVDGKYSIGYAVNGGTGRYGTVSLPAYMGGEGGLSTLSNGGATSGYGGGGAGGQISGTTIVNNALAGGAGVVIIEW